MQVETAARYAGPAAVLVSLGGTLAATVASPSFSWTGNALSELGVVETAAGTETTLLLFNPGLVAGGLLGLGFAWYLVRTAPATGWRATGVVFGLTAAAMGGVGGFPMDQPLHGPVAIAFFLGISGTLALAGRAGIREGSRRYGLASLLGAVAHLAGWVGWLLAGGPEALGLALPELWGSVLLAGWVLLTARRRGGGR
jgi:hypothetical membrane protein